MIPLSFSRMRWIPCPYAFHALYIAKSHKESESEAMLVGREFADIVRDYRRHCYQAGVTSDLSFFDGLKLQYPRTGELIQRFCRSEFAIVPIGATSVMIERRLAFDENFQLITPQGNQSDDDTWFSRDAIFRTIMDFAYCIGDTLHIIDDKTGYGNSDEKQLSTMAALVHRALSGPDEAAVKRVRAQFNYVAQAGDCLAIEFSIDDLEGLIQELTDLVHQVNSWTDYPAIPCDLCGHCIVPDCPIRQQAQFAIVQAAQQKIPSFKLPSEIKTREDAEASLLFRMFLTDLEKQIDQLQREWVRANGPIEAGGKVLGFDSTETWKPIDFQKLAQLMINYGITKEQILRNVSFTRSAIEKTLKQAGKLDRLPMIMPLLEIKKTERFAIKNARADQSDY